MFTYCTEGPLPVRLIIAGGKKEGSVKSYADLNPRVL
jgi:hypothetical protein